MTVTSEADGEKTTKSQRIKFFQVDAMKALMIFLVVFDHTVPWIMKGNMAVFFWERISIPVFMVIIGFNWGLSFKRKGDAPLRELYSRDYFKRKILRFLTPFLILYVVSTIIGLIIYNFDFHALIDNQLVAQWGDLHYLLIGILPFWGPGNWFIPLLFQSILVLPIIYKAFSKKPVLALILCFAVEIAGWFLATSLLDWTTMVLFIVSIPAYLSAIGLGMWFSLGHDITDKRNLFMWILFPLSTIYLIGYQFFNFRFDFVRGDYNFLFYPYSAFIFLIAMKLLPQESENRFTKVIRWIGKSTYHILLTQILYLGIAFSFWGWLTQMHIASVFGVGLGGGASDFIYLLINWMICIPIGVLWCFVETETTYKALFRNSLDGILREGKLMLRGMKRDSFYLVGVIIVSFFAGIALLAPVLAPPEPGSNPYILKIREDWEGSQYFIPPPTPPSPDHPLGTVAGYDIYYGCVWGTRTAFRIGLQVVFIALAIGLFIGCIAGYFGGSLDTLLTAVTDIFSGLPSLLFAMLLIAATAPPESIYTPITFIEELSRLDKIILALAVTGWPTYARLVRGEVIKVKNETYVEAAKAVGCSNFRIIARHVLPNSVSPVIAMAFLNIGGAVLATATLSFLGVGIPVGYADWAPFMAASRNYIISLQFTHAYTFVVPGVFLTTFILGWTLLGDALRDLQDPRIRRM